jgi:hypothetical protein
VPVTLHKACGPPPPVPLVQGMPWVSDFLFSRVRATLLRGAQAFMVRFLSLRRFLA